MAEGFKEIEERFLDRNDIFVLKFRRGLVFLEIKSKSVTKYKPYDNVGEIQPNSALSGGYTQLEEEGTNDDILKVDQSDQDKVLHVSIGHKPWFIRRYTRYPADSGNRGSISNLNFPRPNEGSPYGYVDGKDSPYEDPTEAGELMVPYGPDLGFNFYNPDEDAHEPILNIKMATYSVRALNPSDSNDKNMVKRALSAGSPIPTYIVGVPGEEAEMDSNLKNEYGVRPVTEQKVRDAVF